MDCVSAERQTCRVTACCMPRNGSGGRVQGQSLLKASLVPSSRKVRQRSVAQLVLGIVIEAGRRTAKARLHDHGDPEL